MSESREIGKVLYFDPNNVTIKGGSGNNLNDILDGLQLTKDLEDFSIAVDLEVENKTRSVIKSNDNKQTIVNINPNPTTNFLKGSNLGDKNVLSTYFTDIKYDGENTEFQNEALSINSIDIEFTSWYVASVIIKFTDVRGSAFFSPTEQNYSEGGNEKTSNASLFSGFFTMPYPIFNLKIKGFYGDSVTYPLHLQDFKAEFDSEKGNFDVTAQFIGYTYAMMSDIRMPYLIAAPYIEMYGQSYWEEQVNNGRFLTFEGSKLPKIPDLLKKIKRGQSIITDVNASSENVKNVELLYSKTLIINKIKILINEYVNLIKNTFSTTENNNKYSITDSKGRLNNINLTFKNIVVNKNNIIKSINIFKNTYPNDETFKKYDEKYFELNIISTDNKKAELDLSSILNDINKITEKSDKNIKELNTQIDSTVKNSLSEIYDMIPSVYNFSKLLLAHMETLVHIIAECANEISKTDRYFLDSSMGSGFINDVNNKNETKILPFPQFTYEGKDEWIGKYYPSYKEVLLVKSFLKSYNEVKKDIETTQAIQQTGGIITTKSDDSDNEMVSYKDIWLPINAFDNSINLIGDNDIPYSKIIGSKNLQGELKALLSTRIATIICLSLKNNKDISKYVLIESENIKKQLSYSQDIINVVKKALSDIKTKTKGFNEFDLLRKNGTVYNYKLLDIQELIPLNSETIEYTKNNYIKNKTVKSTKYKYYKSKHFQNNEKPINTVIINGSENCETITKWFEPIENEVKNNYKDLSSIYSNSFKLDKTNSSKSFLEYSYELQPLMNRVAFNQPKLIEGNNTRTITILRYGSGYRSKDDITKQLEGYPNSEIKTNNFIFNDQNENFKSLYKLYLGSDNWSDVKEKKIDILKRQDLFITGNPDISKYTYPMIGGNYKVVFNDNTETIKPVCLFGSPFYYTQTRKKQQDGIKVKAYLFLQTLPITIQSLNDFMLNKKSFMCRMPKSEMLLLGSMLWRKKNDENIKIFVSKSNVKIPDVDSYFRVKNIFHLEVGGNEKVVFDKCQILETIGVDSLMGKEFIKQFENWCNDNSSLDGWGNIREYFEFRKKDNKEFTEKDFRKLMIDYAKNPTPNSFFSVVNDIHFYNYSIIEFNNIPKNSAFGTLGLINKDNSNGVKSVLTLLYNESIINYSGDSDYISEDLKSNLVEELINGILINISKVKPNKTSEKLPEITSESYQTSNTTAVIDNDFINLQVYNYFKILYDKWVSGYNFNTNNSEYKWISTDLKKLNNRDTYIIKNFKFIDRSYNDIGTKFIIDYNKVFESLLNISEDRNLYSTITEVLSSNNFLFLPMPNYQSWNKMDDFKKIFEPIPYINSNITKTVEGDKIASTFVCMYTGEPSKNLNITTSDYPFKDDGLNLNDVSSIPYDFLSESDKINSIEIEDKVPAFAISYGKQNQSYFKKITLNQNNPLTTEAAIMAVRNLLSSNDKNSSAISLSQNLYSVYSQYSYTCQVEMMGCAQIQPMMYFQLTNIPMWNGAYLIYKVNHSIRPGHMTTNFTGMRMSNRYPKLVTPEIISSNNLSSGDQIVSARNNEVSTLDTKTKIGKYFTLGEYTVGEKTIETWVVDRLQNNVAPTIDYIYDTWKVSSINIEKKYGDFIITNGLRNKERNEAAGGVDNSAHIEALAVDVQLKNNSKEGNNALFEHIKQKMREGLIYMDQVIKEPSATGGIVHISPVGIDNNIVRIRGEYQVQNSNREKIQSQSGIIEEAKGSGMVNNIKKEKLKFIEYWKSVENNKEDPDGGWDSSKKLWFAHNSKEGGERTIGYGIKLLDDSLLSLALKNKGIENLRNRSVGITDKEAIEEIMLKADVAYKFIKNHIIKTKQFGEPAFNKIKERYKYAMVDLHLNTKDGISGWPNFVNYAVKNDLNGMIRESKRNLGKRDELFENYLKG